MKKPSFFPVLVGTGFGSGFSPFAPGTAGALLATLIWLGLSFIVSEACLIWLTVAFILFFTILGIWAVNRLEPYWGEDPSRVVVDEMVGVWIPLLAVPDNDKWIWLHLRAVFGMDWGLLLFFACLTFLNRWEFAVWKVFRVDLG